MELLHEGTRVSLRDGQNVFRRRTGTPAQ
jgi:hypothetical protein